MNKKEIRRHRRALTITVFLYIFFIIFISAVISIIILLLLLVADFFPMLEGEYVKPKYILQFSAMINLFVGLLVTYFVNGKALRHLNEILNQMNRLAYGDFKARFRLSKLLNRHPTVREMADCFNKMAEELESTEKLRGDFINNFSHEFKTPIVSIAGFVKLLKHGNLTEEQKKEYLDIIEEESLRLSAMATSILNLTKIENQSILTNLTQFNLSEQIRSSVLVLEPKWTKKDIQLDLEFDEYRIEANEELLKHVWINLIDNAIKFSPDGGTVKISVNKSAESYLVSVENHGSEITQEQQKHIFNKFYQAEESHAGEGYGIGLSLVKGIVELHKGSISVRSDNNTTVFSVILPKYYKNINNIM